MTRIWLRVRIGRAFWTHNGADAKVAAFNDLGQLASGDACSGAAT